MRNDANDELHDVPSLSASPSDHDDFAQHTGAAHERTKVLSRTTPAVKAKAASTGALWALVGALIIALAGLGWWSFQQISLMEQQLVATQESFARISEEAAGRLQAISGKVVATESSANTDSEAFKLQIRKLNAQLLEQSRQQQGVVGQQSGLDKRLEEVLTQSSEQQATNAQLQAALKSLSADVVVVQAQLADRGKLDTQVKSLSEDVAALKKQGNPGAAIGRLEQELIVLKSEQENRPAAAAQGSGASTAEFDAFRRETTGSINTLQSQIQNLQQQISSRP